MSIIGTLRVLLIADTASFDGPLKSSADVAGRASRDIQNHLDKIDTREARGGLMLMGDLFGIHLPRHVLTFVASLGPVAAAMEAAFPFLVIAVAAERLIEHFSKLHEQTEHLEEAGRRYEITINQTFLSLNDKLLEAQRKADELNQDHLGALQKTLELIDHQSMKELLQQFDNLKKAADDVFKELGAHWYTVGKGSEGAKHSLDDIIAQYKILRGAGSEAEKATAEGYLASALERDKKILDDMTVSMQGRAAAGTAAGASEEFLGKVTAANARLDEQRAIAGSALTEDQVKAQQKKVETLENMAKAQGLVNAADEQEKQNAKTGEAHREQGEAFKEAQRENREQEIIRRQREEAYRDAVKDIQDGERLQIEATKAGTKERLAALDAAILEENHKGLQDTAMYKSMVYQREQLIIQLAQEEKRIREEADKITKEHDIKSAEITAQGELEGLRHKQAMRHAFFASDLADQIETENKKYEITKKAMEKQIADLDTSDKDYLNKKKQLENKEIEMTQQHENKLHEIRNKAQEKMVAEFDKAFGQMNSTLINFVNTGKFNWRSLATGAIDSIVEIGLKYVEHKIEMMIIDKLFGAQKAGQNTAQATSNVALAATEALASVPWPFNIAAAAETEAVGAGFVAETMVGFYAQGGIVPNDMPAFVHKNEMVLPAHIAHHVMQTAGGGGKGGNVHYNPVIHGNADEAKLHEHFKKFMKQMIRTGKV